MGCIKFTVCVEEVKNMMLGPTDISVTVHRAQKLLIKGKGSSNDAYATMEFEGEKFATNVVEKSCDPTWHQECQFKLPSGGVVDKLTVTICVFNKHHGKFGLQNDDFIGIVKVPLGSLKLMDNKEQRKWYELEHKNPKKEKKQRGEVEVGFKFISRERFSLLPDKKSPKSLKNFTSKLGNKIRRRSVDEDSGVGVDNFPMRKGMSMDNLRRTPSSASDGAASKKRLSLIDIGPAASARGIAKLSNKMGLGGNKGKATSAEVLNRPGIMKVSSASNLKRSSSGGRADSGNTSLTTSAENLHRSGSGENIEPAEFSSMENLHASHNENYSNSKERNPFADVPKSSLSVVYKPKSYYRLDVKDLCKVSPIPEDPAVTFQQMDKQELVRICINQHNTILNKNEHIRELEDYIDSLLVKVMVATPQILDQSQLPQTTKF